MKRFAALATLAALAPGQATLAEEQQAPVRASQYQEVDEYQQVEGYQRSDKGPAIVIRNQDDQTFYEYRVNGVLQEIRVEPEVGPTYYLIPVDGGFIRSDNSQLLLPSWVLFSW